jgi:4-hydroxyphenylacetate 3-monooxygenase
MALQTGAQYLESLRDGRQVWLEGERVDVTSHPLLAGCARTLAQIYDLQHEPMHRDLLTMESPSSGEPVSLAYLLPRSKEDIVRQRKLAEFLNRRTGGVMGRLAQFMANVLVGLYDVRDILAQEDPAFADNVEAYFEHCRENDVCLTHGFGDPTRTRDIAPDRFENIKVVDEGPDGIVLRGVKGVATLAPYANEYLGLTAPRPGMTPPQIVYFATRMDVPGMHVVCRKPLAQPTPEDHPLSAFFDEMEAWVIFDDVFIPRERVFYLRGVEMNEPIFRRVLGFGSFHNLVRFLAKAEVLTGICVAAADYLGTTKMPHTQDVLTALIGYTETLRAFVHGAECNPELSTSGLLLPNPIQVLLGRMLATEQHPRMLQLVREVCGTSLLMAPGHAEMQQPELRAAIDRYLVGPDERAPERYLLMKLAWEYLADSFGSRQLLFEMHNAGSVTTNKNRLLAEYDTGPAVQLAKQLAGID